MKKSSLPGKSSRRIFIKGLGYAMLTLPAMSIATNARDRIISSLTLSQSSQGYQDKKLGLALVGLGQYSTEQLAPALQETKYCKLSGIVTGSSEKAERWKDKYSIPGGNIYTYQNLDAIKDNPAIDIVYIVLPNAMHADFTIRAARAGKHVICEKPMGVNVEECKAMIAACNEANRLLSIGYRLHFEPHNMTMQDMTRKKTFGAVQKVMAQNSNDIKPGVWRLDKELSGGGPLMDIGIYCVQGAIYTVGENPIAVTAKEGKKTDMERFSEVEQSISWEMEFPNGVVAQCYSAYDTDQNLLRAEAERGWYELKPAFRYTGIKGSTSKERMKLPNVNQQALQMDDFASCIIRNEKSKVPGEMGLRDMKILTAIYEAARTGQRVMLNDL